MDNKYCYRDCDVLVNKYDIKDKEILEELERESVNTKLLSLELRPEQIQCDLSIDHLKAIHKFLFDNLYEWAGKFRDIDIMKEERVLSGASVDYAHYESIILELDEFILSASKLNWNNHEEIIVSAFKLLLGIWEIHPFREGNTRTCITFMKRFLSTNGIEFNAKLLKHHPSYVRDSLVMATYDEPKYLMNILTDAFKSTENDMYFNKNEVSNEYRVVKEKYYTAKEANKLKIKKRNKKA